MDIPSDASASVREDRDAQCLSGLWRQAIAHQNGNVHAFNRNVVKPNLSTLEEIFERKYGMDFLLEGTGRMESGEDTAAAALVRGQIREYFVERLRQDGALERFHDQENHGGRGGGSSSSGGDAQILLSELHRALTLLFSYCQDSRGGTYADAETGVGDVILLLRKNWFLGQKLAEPGSCAIPQADAGGHEAETETSHSRRVVVVTHAACDTIIDSLLENKRTDGGCSPGFAGRFFRDMLELLSHLHGLKICGPPPGP
ncbi:unnamed protein product [Amoebophrya sp. A25]|nr:unnamed protein product [Amoebophrya sp. A25]|eukprot:GSA25T00010795001.1